MRVFEWGCCRGSCLCLVPRFMVTQHTHIMHACTAHSHCTHTCTACTHGTHARHTRHGTACLHACTHTHMHAYTHTAGAAKELEVLRDCLTKSQLRHHLNNDAPHNLPPDGTHTRHECTHTPTQPARPHVRTNAHMTQCACSHVRACVHTRTHARTHAHGCTAPHAHNARMCTCAYALAHARAHIHARTHGQHTCTVRAHAQSHARSLGRMQA